jgi:hypothetical protein
MNVDGSYCYLNGSLAFNSVTDMLSSFENNGCLAVSLVKNFQTFSVTERNTISILQTLIENNKHNIINKIVNTVTDSRFNVKVNNKDISRKAFGVSFNSEFDDVNTTLADDVLRTIWNDIVSMGIADPDSKPTNGDGCWGVDLLDKDYGCGTQLKHFDFPQFINGLEFKSFANIMGDISKKNKYDRSRDGGVSVFVNPFGHSDYLMKGDGSFIEIPPYSYLVLRGNVIHCGTGNVSQFEGIYKIFFYGDPPNYNRNGSDNQYRVFMPPGHEYHTSVREKSTDEVIKIAIIPPYTCTCCGKSARYTYPYCKQCLQTIWNFELTWRKNSTHVVYVGDTLLLEGFVFPQNICGDILSNNIYRKIHSDLQGETILAFQLCNEVEELMDLYLDCLYKRSFVASIQTTTDKRSANVRLIFDSRTKTVRMVCVREVSPHCQIVMYVQRDTFTNEKYYVDIEEYSVLNAKNK